jgi:hypothetical protein
MLTDVAQLPYQVSGADRHVLSVLEEEAAEYVSPAVQRNNR